MPLTLSFLFTLRFTCHDKEKENREDPFFKPTEVARDGLSRLAEKMLCHENVDVNAEFHAMTQLGGAQLMTEMSTLSQNFTATEFCI